MGKFRFTGAAVALALCVSLLAGCNGGGSIVGNPGGGGGGGSTKPNPPTNLTVRRGSVQLSHFTLGWNPSTSTVAGYVIFRKLQSQTSFSAVPGGATSGTTFVDTTVPASVAFDEVQYYVVAATSSGIQSDPSNIVTIAGGGPPPPP